jgi:hypothetical protein
MPASTTFENVTGILSVHKKASASILKKSSKKLLLNGAAGAAGATAPRE